MREGLLDLHQTISRALKQGEDSGKFTPQQVEQLTNARNVLGRFIQYVPFWVIFLSALALGLGTAFGYEKIVVTLGEKMGSAHMNPAQGTAAQASAIIGIGLANFGGMPVSTTHVLSAAVLGSVAGTRGEKVNMHTVGKIAVTWFTTLPGTVIVSFVLSVIFYVALVYALSIKSVWKRQRLTACGTLESSLTALTVRRCVSWKLCAKPHASWAPTSTLR